MPDAPERLISAATVAFDDNAEMRIAVERELRGLMEQHRELPPGCDSAEECASSLKASQTPQGKRWRRAGLCAAILATLIGGWSAYAIFAKRKVIDRLGNSDLLTEADLPVALVAPDATPDERRILFGDFAGTPRENRFKSLWEMNPDNPVYFREYALSYHASLNRLPPDFSTAAAKIDPENGYFVIIEACAEAVNSVKEARVSGLRKDKPKPPPTWIVRDAARMNGALEKLERAASLPKWNSYRKELLVERLKLLPKAQDTLDRLIQTNYFETIRGSISFHTALANVIAAKADQCAKEQDTEGFQRLLQSWDAIVPKLIDEPAPSLFESVVLQSSLSFTSQNLCEAAKSLGFEEEAKRLERGLLQLKRRPGARDGLNSGAESREQNYQAHGSFLLGTFAIAESYRLGPPPPIAEQDLKPGRLADYELANRAGALIGWALLAIAAILAGIYRFRGGFFTRRLSHTFAGLLRPVDWLWIIAGGVLLPFFFLEVLARVTPLGGRDWSVVTHGLIVTSGQLLATLILMLLLPLAIARWRLGKRGALLGLRSGRQWGTHTVIALCLMALLLFGAGFLLNDPAFYSGRNQFADLDITEETGQRMEYFLTASVTLGLGLGWWLLLCIRGLFGSSGKMLRRAVLSRVLTTAYIAGMLLMAFAMPAYHALEKHYISQDWLMERTVDTLPFEWYPHGIAKVYRDHLLQIFKPAS